MNTLDESDRCKSGCATLADVLCDLGSDHFCMERERTARKHLHISRNGVIKIYGRNHASMATVGSWAGGWGEAHTRSGGSECESAMCRLRT